MIENIIVKKITLNNKNYDKVYIRINKQANNKLI